MSLLILNALFGVLNLCIAYTYRSPFNLIVGLICSATALLPLITL